MSNSETEKLAEACRFVKETIDGFRSHDVSFCCAPNKLPPVLQKRLQGMREHFLVLEALNDPYVQPDTAYYYAMCLLYEWGCDFHEENARNAFNLAETIAAQEHEKGQCLLGTCYIEGRGGNSVPKKGVEYLTQSIETGLPEAYYILAELAFSSGIGFENSDVINLLTQAAERGYVPAMYRLGAFYAEGKVTKQDEFMAAAWLGQAAENGHVVAQCALGNCYALGFGLDRDFSRALEWYVSAYQNGSIHAEKMLRVLTSKHLNKAGLPKNSNNLEQVLFSAQMKIHGIGIPKNPAEGLKMLQFAYLQNENLKEIFWENSGVRKRGELRAHPNLLIVRGMARAYEKEVLRQDRLLSFRGPVPLLLEGPKTA